MMRISFPLPSMGDLEKRYDACTPFYEAVLEKLVKAIRAATAENNLSATLRHRVKDFASWYKKLLLRIPEESCDSTALLITDVLGIRIVCPFLEEVNQVSLILQEIFTVREREVKGADYAAGHFGYESEHFLIDVPSGFLPSKPVPEFFPKKPVCEIQIRTILQEAWAEVEHELVYKSDFSPLDNPLKRKLAALNANLTLSDIMFQEIRDYQKDLHTALKKRSRDFYKRIRANGGHDGEIQRPITQSSEYSVDPSKDTMDALLLQGLLLHNEGQYEKAIAIYSEILERDLETRIRSIILVHRGMAFFSKGGTTEAAADFDQALRLDPGHSKARYYRAIQSRLDGHFEEAYRDLEACIRADPYNLEYLTARAETALAAGDRKTAAADCDTVLRIDPAFKPALRIQKDLAD